MLISVIVPVYNTEQYLPECIESILNQTYKNIEILLVDDGSEDESLNICREYSKKDTRIIVIANKHQGLVATRKSGVKSARGEYCLFVDSDDWVSTDLVKEILPLTEGGSTDIVNYSLRNIDGVKSVEWSYTIPEGIYGERLDDIYSKMIFDFENGCSGIIQSLCSKLIKKNILWSSMEGVDENITLGEDAAVVYKAMLLSKKIAITNKCFYFYRVRQNSMYHSKSSDVFDKICCFQKYMRDLFLKYDEEYKLEDQLKYYLMSFIRKGLEDVYGIKLLNLYRMPFETLELHKRIVLYGAGSVGKSFYRQLKQEDNVEIVAWVDNGLKGKKVYDRTIESQEVIRDMVFDNIIIAVKEKNLAEEIKQQLLTCISEEKIWWKPPQINWWEKEIGI